METTDLSRWLLRSKIVNGLISFMVSIMTSATINSELLELSAL